MNEKQGLPGCRAARVKLGWSQQKLAERAGFSLPYISMLELGKTDPSIHNAVRLAEVLGVPLAQLLAAPPDEAATA